MSCGQSKQRCLGCCPHSTRAGMATSYKPMLVRTARLVRKVDALQQTLAGLQVGELAVSIAAFGCSRVVVGRAHGWGAVWHTHHVPEADLYVHTQLCQLFSCAQLDANRLVLLGTPERGSTSVQTQRISNNLCILAPRAAGSTEHSRRTRASAPRCTRACPSRPRQL